MTKERMELLVSFNPRTRVGCDDAELELIPTNYCFNPRTRVGCDRKEHPILSSDSGFNPRTRVGCDAKQRKKRRGLNVSIHAPAWGATPGSPVPCFPSNVSIHAPAWGATKTGGVVGHISCFNPRTRVGCDIHPVAISNVPFVSIHAPAWGATPAGPKTSSRRSCFNPRTRVGCDCYNLDIVCLSQVFQSTHPRGVRQ